MRGLAVRRLSGLLLFAPPALIVVGLERAVAVLEAGGVNRVRRHGDVAGHRDRTPHARGCHAHRASHDGDRVADGHAHPESATDRPADPVPPLSTGRACRDS